MEEIWKDIVGWEDSYMVNNLGTVISKARLIWNGVCYFESREHKMTQSLDSTGYYCMYFSNNNKRSSVRVHRIIAKAFIPNPDNKKTVNHIDGNKLNNNIDNLEWCTQKENVRHAWDNNLSHPSMKNKFGENHHSSIKIAKFDSNLNKISEFFGVNEACRVDGEKVGKISWAIKHGTKTKKGFYWQRIVNN